MRSTLSAKATLLLLQEAASIKPDGECFRVTRVGGHYIRVTKDELEQVDARLPQALSYICKHMMSNDQKTLRRTLAHWAIPMAPAGVGHAFMRPIKVMEDTVINGETESFTITASRHKLFTVCEGVEVVGSGDSAFAHKVPASWMKQHYTDIFAKFGVLKALGLKPKEISKLVLEESVVPNAATDMTELSFD